MAFSRRRQHKLEMRDVTILPTCLTNDLRDGLAQLRALRRTNEGEDCQRGGIVLTFFTRMQESATTPEKQLQTVSQLISMLHDVSTARRRAASASSPEACDSPLPCDDTSTSVSSMTVLLRCFIFPFLLDCRVHYLHRVAVTLLRTHYDVNAESVQSTLESMVRMRLICCTRQNATLPVLSSSFPGACISDNSVGSNTNNSNGDSIEGNLCHDSNTHKDVCSKSSDAEDVLHLFNSLDALSSTLMPLMPQVFARTFWRVLPFLADGLQSAVWRAVSARHAHGCTDVKERTRATPTLSDEPAEDGEEENEWVVFGEDVDHIRFCIRVVATHLHRHMHVLREHVLAGSRADGDGDSSLEETAGNKEMCSWDRKDNVCTIGGYYDESYGSVRQVLTRLLLPTFVMLQTSQFPKDLLNATGLLVASIVTVRSCDAAWVGQLCHYLCHDDRADERASQPVSSASAHHHEDGSMHETIWGGGKNVDEQGKGHVEKAHSLHRLHEEVCLFVRLLCCADPAAMLVPSAQSSCTREPTTRSHSACTDATQSWGNDGGRALHRCVAHLLGRVTANGRFAVLKGLLAHLGHRSSSSSSRRHAHESDDDDASVGVLLRPCRIVTAAAAEEETEREVARGHGARDTSRRTCATTESHLSSNSHEVTTAAVVPLYDVIVPAAWRYCSAVDVPETRFMAIQTMDAVVQYLAATWTVVEQQISTHQAQRGNSPDHRNGDWATPVARTGHAWSNTGCTTDDKSARGRRDARDGVVADCPLPSFFFPLSRLQSLLESVAQLVLDLWDDSSLHVSGGLYATYNTILSVSEQIRRCCRGSCVAPMMNRCHILRRTAAVAAERRGKYHALLGLLSVMPVRTFLNVLDGGTEDDADEGGGCGDDAVGAVVAHEAPAAHSSVLDEHHSHNRRTIDHNESHDGVTCARCRVARVASRFATSLLTGASSNKIGNIAGEVYVQFALKLRQAYPPPCPTEKTNRAPTPADITRARADTTASPVCDVYTDAILTPLAAALGCHGFTAAPGNVGETAHIAHLAAHFAIPLMKQHRDQWPALIAAILRYACEHEQQSGYQRHGGTAGDELGKPSDASPTDESTPSTRWATRGADVGAPRARPPRGSGRRVGVVFVELLSRVCAAPTLGIDVSRYLDPHSVVGSILRASLQSADFTVRHGALGLSVLSTARSSQRAVDDADAPTAVCPYATRLANECAVMERYMALNGHLGGDAVANRHVMETYRRWLKRLDVALSARGRAAAPMAATRASSGHHKRHACRANPQADATKPSCPAFTRSQPSSPATHDTVHDEEWDVWWSHVARSARLFAALMGSTVCRARGLAMERRVTAMTCYTALLQTCLTLQRTPRGVLPGWEQSARREKGLWEVLFDEALVPVLWRDLSHGWTHARCCAAALLRVFCQHAPTRVLDVVTADANHNTRSSAHTRPAEGRERRTEDARGLCRAGTVAAAQRVMTQTRAAAARARRYRDAQGAVERYMLARGMHDAAHRCCSSLRAHGPAGGEDGGAMSEPAEDGTGRAVHDACATLTEIVAEVHRRCDAVMRQHGRARYVCVRESPTHGLLALATEMFRYAMELLARHVPPATMRSTANGADTGETSRECGREPTTAAADAGTPHAAQASAAGGAVVVVVVREAAHALLRGACRVTEVYAGLAGDNAAEGRVALCVPEACAPLSAAARAPAVVVHEEEEKEEEEEEEEGEGQHEDGIAGDNARPDTIDCRGHVYDSTESVSESDMRAVVNSTWLSLRVATAAMGRVVELCDGSTAKPWCRRDTDSPPTQRPAAAAAAARDAAGRPSPVASSCPAWPPPSLRRSIVWEACAALVRTLLLTKHNGVMGCVRGALTRLARALLRSREDDGRRRFPAALLRHLLGRGGVTSSDAARMLRRSQGLTHAIVAILEAEEDTLPLVLFPRALRALLIQARPDTRPARTGHSRCESDATRDGHEEDGEEEEEEEEDSRERDDGMYAVARDWAKGGGGGGHATRAHDADARRGCHRANALHVLKFIVENKRFGDRVGGVLEECLCLATAGFRHPRWYIRNSSLMLFHAVLQRVVGAPTAAPSPSLCPSSPSGATWSDMGGGGTGRGGGAPTSLYDMATRTPRAVRFAYEELTHLVHARRGGRDRVPHSVALFPILHMLSMLAPDPPHLAGGSPGVRRSPPPPPHTHTHTHTHAQWDEGADSGGGGGASCYSSSSAVATMTACVPDGAAMARAVMDCLGAESWMIRAASARALLCLVPVPHRVRYVAVVQSRLREALRAHECRGVAEGGEGGGDGGGGVGECCTTWANRLNEIHGALLVLHEFHRRAVAAHPRCVHGGAVRPGVCATDQAGENAAAALAHVGHGETAAASCRAAHMPRKTPHADDCQVMWEMVVYPLLTARSALVAVCARCPILATAFMDLAVDALTHTPACLGPWNPTAPDTITTASHRLSEDATYRRATDTTSLCDTDSRCNEAGALSALADMAVEVMGRGCYGACVAGSKRPVSRRKDACRTTTTTPHTDRPSCRRAVCGRDVREACHAVPLRRRVGHTHALASAARVLWTVVRYDRLAIAGPTVNSAAPIVHDARTNSDDGGHGEEEEGSVGGGGTEAVRRDAHRGMDDFLSRAQGGLGCATSLWGVGVPTIFSSLFEYVSTHTRPDSRAVHSTSPHHTDPCARVGRRDDGGMQDEDDEDDRNRAAWPYRAEHDDSSGGGGGAGLFAPQDVTRVTRVLYTRYDCSLLALCLSGLWSVLVCGCSTHHHSHHSPRGLAVAAPMIQRDEGRVPTGERGRILCRCRGLRGLNALSWQAFTAHVRFLSCVHAEASTGALAGTECATQMDRLFHVLLDVVLLSSSSGTRESAAGPPLLRNSDAQSVVIVYLGRHARYALSVFDEQHSNREKERLSDVSRESRAMVPGMRFLGDSPPHVSHLYSDRSVWNSVPAAVHTGGVATTLDGVVAALMRYAQPDRCPRTRMAVLTALRDLLPAFHVPQDSASNDATHRRQEHSTACATDRPSSGNATEEDAPRGASAMLDNGGKRGVDAIVTTGEGETELVPASTTQSMRHMASGRRHTAQSVRARLLLVLLRLLCDDAHDIRQRACVVCSSTILRAGAAYGARDQMSCVLAVVLQLRAHAQRGEMTEGAFAQCFEDMLGGRSHDTARDNAATNVGRHENDESKASSSFSCAKDVTKEASRRSHRDANDGKDTGSSEDDEDDEEVEEEEDALFTREVDNMFIETTMVRYWHSRIFATAAVSVSFPVLDDLLDDAIRHDRAEVVIA